jgi:HSP20 family protein
MPIHVLQIVREVSDRGGFAHQKRTYYCSELEAPACSCWKPNTDIFESQDEVKIRLELAGVPRENITVAVKGGKLTVTGSRPEKRPGERLYYHQLELNYGHFKRVISLPESIEHNDIQATLEEGVLEIVISKNERAIEIPISGMNPAE